VPLAIESPAKVVSLFPWLRAVTVAVGRTDAAAAALGRLARSNGRKARKRKRERLRQSGLRAVSNEADFTVSIPHCT